MNPWTGDAVVVRNSGVTQQADKWFVIASERATRWCGSARGGGGSTTSSPRLACRAAGLATVGGWTAHGRCLCRGFAGPRLLWAHNTPERGALSVRARDLGRSWDGSHG